MIDADGIHACLQGLQKVDIADIGRCSRRIEANFMYTDNMSSKSREQDHLRMNMALDINNVFRSKDIFRSMII